MSRVQLALNVSDLDDAIAFYSKLFGSRPAKVRPGYANFFIEQPPLKLVLIERRRRSRTRGPSTTSGSRSGRRERGRRGRARSCRRRVSRPRSRGGRGCLLLALQEQGVGRRTRAERPGRSTPFSPTGGRDAGRRARPADDAAPACCDTRSDLAPAPGHRSPLLLSPTRTVPVRSTSSPSGVVCWPNSSAAPSWRRSSSGPASRRSSSRPATPAFSCSRTPRQRPRGCSRSS